MLFRSLTVANGRVTALKTSVGTKWSGSSGRVTDLGTVSAAEASTYFFALIPQLEGRSKRERLLLPAVLADDPNTVPRLVALARDAARTKDIRQESIQWIGLLGDASVVPTLVAFVRQNSSTAARDDDDDDPGPGEDGIANSAIAALSFVRNGAGVPALIDFARNGSASVRRSTVFWLGQSGDPRAIATLHSVIENPRETDGVRAGAIFSLSHGNTIPGREFAYLRDLYPRLTSLRLKESILMGMSEDESNGSAWLIEKARDRSESIESRKKALFWAGQSKATPTKDIVAVYKGAQETSLREHAIFVLSQRDDEAATNELLRIAREDSDKQMRSKALFWLAQKDDPRVAKLISERVTR